ncbi:MAG: SAM-dependent methyltransferase [Myxococcota bacterium]
MRDGWPSLTALAVAVARGIGTAPGEIDDSAADLVPNPIGPALRWVGHGKAPTGVRTALRVATFGLVDHVSLRRAEIDAALHEAIADGIGQLVVLGAGLDGRAWRLESLREVTVFEVDHPATQAGKRQRASARDRLASAVHFVAVDFERDSVADKLAEAGHDADQPTVWIWEGVTPYLHHEAIEASLADVARRSAPGSRLIVSYAIPQLVEGGGRTVDAITEAGFSVLGEPLHGAIATSDFVAMLGRHGFAVQTDSNNRQWAQRHEGNATLARLFSAERLMVAERR